MGPTTTHTSNMIVYTLLLLCFNIVISYVYGNTPPERTNFCERAHAVQNGKIARNDALSGLNITVGLLSTNFNDDGSLKKNSFSIRNWNKISQSANFTWRDSYYIVDTPKGNETYFDVLCKTAELYDLVGDWYSATPQRISNRIIFSEDVIDVSAVMIQDTSTDWSILMFFGWKIWIGFGITVFVSGVVYFFVDFLESQRKNIGMEATLKDQIFYVAYTFTGQSLNDPTSTSTKLIAFSVGFLTLLSISVYTALLTDMLISNEEQAAIKNVNDVIKHNKTMCVKNKTAIHDIMKIRYPNANILPYDGKEKDFYKKLDKKECDFCIQYKDYWHKDEMDKDINKNCDLKMAGDPVAYLKGALSAKESDEYCTSLLIDVVSLHIIQGENNKREDRRGSCESKEKNGSITIREVGDIFIIHFSVMGLAVIFSLCKCCFTLKDEPGAIEKMTEVIKTRRSLKTAVSEHVKKNQESQSILHEDSLKMSSTISIPDVSLQSSSDSVRARMPSFHKDVTFSDTLQSSQGNAGKSFLVEVEQDKLEYQNSIRETMAAILSEIDSFRADVQEKTMYLELIPETLMSKKEEPELSKDELESDKDK